MATLATILIEPIHFICLRIIKIKGNLQNETLMLTQNFKTGFMQFDDTTHSSGGDLLGKFKQLVAENKSLTERLRECENIIAARENEIDMLNQLVSEASEMRSSIDNQLQELKSHQEEIEQMKNFIKNMADFYDK